MSVVVATIAGAPAIVYALLFVGGAVWVLATIWMRTPIAAVVLVAVLAAVSLTVRAVHRDSWTAGGWERVGKHLPPVSSVPADHPAVALLERLSALAGVEVPDLERVGAPGLNACVVVGHGTRAIRVTDGALDGLTGPQLEAVLAHELFHLAHGDARSASRWESAADIAGDETSWSGRFVRAGLRELLRARELAADRAAVLLTGRAAPLVEAIEICSAGRGDIPDQDLRVVGAAAFVASDAAATGPLATHPSTQERLEVAARAAAQLGKR